MERTLMNVAPRRTGGAPNAEPLVILHLTAPARIGGLERVVEALATGHAQAGFAVHVAAVAATQAEAEAFLHPLGKRSVHVHPIVLPGRSYIRERALVRDLCRRLRPSALHTHGYRSDVISSGIAREFGTATISTVHGFTGGDRRNRMYEWLQVQALKRLDAVVAVSTPLASQLKRLGVPSYRLDLLVNAWPGTDVLLDRTAARAMLGLTDVGHCACWVGRLTPEKGADVLLEAVALLPSDIMVSFIGDGPERETLQARATALGLGSRVRWHGIVPHAGAVLRAFDAFVLSSRTEGTPIALLEAMNSGVPIVATRVGGVPDMLRESEAVLIAPDDPAGLAAAIVGQRRNPAAAMVRAAAARRALSERFAIGQWLAGYEAIYRRIA